MTDRQVVQQPARRGHCPLRALMGFDFERLLDEFDEFVAALEVDDRSQALALWSTFEKRLRRRLLLEEQLLLPAFAQARALEAQLLRHEQQRLRHALVHVSSSLQLHTLRSEHLRGFLRLLRSHAHRKDALYAWAELHLAEQARLRVLGILQGDVGDPNAEEAGQPFEAWR